VSRFSRLTFHLYDVIAASAGSFPMMGGGFERDISSLQPGEALSAADCQVFHTSSLATCKRALVNAIVGCMAGHEDPPVCMRQTSAFGALIHCISTKQSGDDVVTFLREGGNCEGFKVLTVLFSPCAAPRLAIRLQDCPYPK
jgi:hypothetical protein